MGTDALSEIDEIRSLADGLTRFLTEYAEVVTSEAAAHVANAVTVLASIAPLGHRLLSPKPQLRICGLCPCEMSDLIKEGGRV